jgi:cell division protein FtsQ
MSGSAPRRRRPGPRGQRRVGWKAAFFGVAVIAIVAGVAWALLGSRFLIVRSVQVTGTGPMVSRAEVLAAAHIRRGLPLIRVNTSAVAHRVGGIRQVESAQVSVSDVGGGTGSDWSDGPGGVPSLRDSPLARAAAKVLRDLPPQVARRVRMVSAASASNVSLQLANGVVIVWGDTSRPGEKAKELTLLMRTHARTYDVSAPGTAVTEG